MPNPTTMILRFRDLSTNQGDTIRLHKERIEAHGSTWWGWWRKAHEKVPETVFQYFVDQLNAGEDTIEVFLFDSGSSQIYPARLTGIAWHKNEDDDEEIVEIESPEPARSPDYYEGRTLLAWFQFTDIGDPTKDPNTVQIWTYLQVNELFTTNRSTFQRFYGKQIHSFNELKIQERTIWFVRLFSPETDETGEVDYDTLVLRLDKRQPDNFPKIVVDHPSPRLLWLSDVHFSQDHHAFPLHPGEPDRKNLSEAIRNDLESIGIQDVGGILITGDLTWRATPEEFELFATFLDDILSWSTLKEAHVVFCPGNHDIRFTDRPWEKGTVVNVADAEAQQAYRDFHRNFFNTEPDEYLSLGRRYLLANSVCVEVVSLNSSMLNQTENIFQGHGYVGSNQLSHVAEEMEWNSKSGAGLKPFRIAMLHHHLVPILPFEDPVYGRQLSVVYDAGNVSNWVVDHRVNLVLHGHMHHTRIVKESRSRKLTEDADWHDFVIASLGSSGVILGEDALHKENVYGLLEFTGEECIVQVRAVSARDPDMPIDPTRAKVNIRSLP